MSKAVRSAFSNRQAANAAAADLASGDLVVARRKETVVVEDAPPPYTTADLLDDVTRRWGWSGERVMATAQRLFECGWITYPRTDSTRLSADAQKALRRLVVATYGPQALAAQGKPKRSPASTSNVPPKQGRTFSPSRLGKLGESFLQRWKKAGRGKVSTTKAGKGRPSPTTPGRVEDAHEAIRPTDPRRSPDELDEVPQRQLYALIRKRSLASQMKPARMRSITVTLKTRS